MESYIWLLILVVFTGASYGMINPIASKGLTLWFDVKNRATAFGIRQMGVTAGGAIAGVLLIYLARLKNWNLAVLVVGLLSVLIGIAGYLFYKEAPLEAIKTPVSKKAAPKMTILDLLKNRNLLILCLIMALLCLGQSSIASFLVLYLKEYLGLTSILAGSFLTITMICGGGARVFWGIVSDRLFHSKRLPVMKIICLLAALSALLVFLYGSNLPSPFFIPIVVFFGFSYLGFQGIAVVLMVEVCGPELAGRATGLGITIAWVGMVLGPVIFGALAEAGYHFAWLFITIASSLSVLLCYTIHE
jgi:sugar phosphate permease